MTKIGTIDVNFPLWKQTSVLFFLLCVCFVGDGFCVCVCVCCCFLIHRNRECISVSALTI